MKDHEDTQKTQNWSRIHSVDEHELDHADNWIDADWWSSDWNMDLWIDFAWGQAARQLPSTQLAHEQSNPTHGESISMPGFLTMCESPTLLIGFFQHPREHKCFLMTFNNTSAVDRVMCLFQAHGLSENSL